MEVTDYHSFIKSCKVEKFCSSLFEKTRQVDISGFQMFQKCARWTLPDVNINTKPHDKNYQCSIFNRNLRSWIDNIKRNPLDAVYRK